MSQHKEQKESPEITISKLRKEVSELREKMRGYKRVTQFVWNDMSAFRALCHAGLAARVPEVIAARMTTNPLWQFKPTNIDGVLALEIPAQRICIHEDDVPAELRT